MPRKKIKRVARLSRARAPARPARKIGYAVVGLGHIAQEAVLPAFEHAGRNSRLVALVSGDDVKRKRLSSRYHVKSYSYDDYDACLQDEEVEAVYIALPNNMHAEYTERAARAGVHVLCEKPMATSEDECRRMIQACRETDVRLMIAYRLHFEKANLAAVEAIESGRLGDPRFFTSEFSYQVKEGNIRTQAELGGGPVWDIGIYCINAARYLFRAEPTQVFAFAAKSPDRRFREINEAVSVCLRFPDERLATFLCSYGAGATATYRLVGTRGDLRLDNAYEYKGEIHQRMTVGTRVRDRTYPPHDQFSPELLYFSSCVLEGTEPEPSGEEGLADVRIIEAIHRSIVEARPIDLPPIERGRRPEPSQEISQPPVQKPEPIGVESPHL